jgi:hypothetical protein
VVEWHRPEGVPFDLAAELHLKVDTSAIAYRRPMRQPGVATTDATAHLASASSS